MPITFAWELQGSTPTSIVIADDDVLRFAGATFADPIVVGEYNDSTHVKDGDDGSDKSSGNTPNNVKFISQSGGTGGDSQADWGDGTEDLDQITNAEATLKITITNDTNVTVTDAVFYSYNGVTPATAPVGMDVRAAEVGDANWTQAEGSASPLELTDSSTPATSHDFYIALSKSPTGVGIKTSTDRFEAVIQ